MNTKSKADFDRLLLEIERNLNKDPAKAYDQLADLKESPKNVDQRRLLYCDVLMGRCMQRQGRSIEAYNIIATATELLAELEAPRETAMGYHYMSQLSALRGEYETAHEYAIRGLLIAEKANDWYAQMNLQLDMAPVYNSVSEYDKCLEIYQKAKEILENHVIGNEPSIEGNEEYTAFIIESNIAFYYRKLEKFEEALSCLEKTGDAAKTILDGMYLDKFHIDYASICLSLDKIDELKKHMDIIVDLITKKERSFMRSVPNNYISLCEKMLEKHITYKVEPLLMLIQDATKEEENHYILFAMYDAFARYYMEVGDTQKELENYRKAINHAGAEVNTLISSSKQNVERREQLQKYANQREAIEKSFNEGKIELAAAKLASEAKGSFMSRMSHEIRTPLNAIIGYNEIASKILSEAKNEAARKEAIMRALDSLKKCGVASRHLLTIVNDVLDISAIESGKIHLSRDRFDFKGMISSLTTVFYSQAKTRGVNLEIILCDMYEEWFVGDSLRITQVLTNILSNAVKFTNEGGSVVMRVTQQETAKTARFHFEIEDTGIGMSEEYLKKIWAPFEQADYSISRRFGGTGLGMTITKTLVDLMGGNIEIKSEVGKGTTFFVDLELERTEQPHSSNRFDFSTINALVVDDDPVVCNYIEVLFERCGARCTTVTSGADAIQACKEAEKNKDNFSLCLVDWKMPKMDGIETIRRIKKIVGKPVPVVVLSAYDYSEITDESAKVGIDRFISKPLFQSTLFNLLADLCGIHSTDRAMARDKHFDFSGKRILLAEDNDMNMDIATTILSTANLEIDGAINGKIAVEKFISSKEGYYDAILMDVQMPIMDGHEATRVIRASSHPQAKTIPIIAMTADAFAENIAQSHEAGMNGHISKPFETEHLFNTIAEYLTNDSKGTRK